jgi:hypothetical protein
VTPTIGLRETSGIVGGAGHTRGMTTMEVPLLPGWVVPARSEVSDLQWLAYRLWRFENTGAFPSAVHATTKWVLGWGEERGPATGVEGQPVTEDMAHEELAAAVRVSEMALQSAGRDFLVHWTYGVRHTLSWLLGVPGANPLTGSRFGIQNRTGARFLRRSFTTGRSPPILSGIRGRPSGGSCGSSVSATLRTRRIWQR